MTSTQNVPEDRIQIGQLRSAYGLNGWLWVYSNTEPMSNMFDYLPWYIETKAGWQTIDVKRWKPHGKGLVVALKGVSDRTGAESLVGANIWIAKSQLPKADVDEYYWSDLKGLTVLGLDEEEQEVNLGKIHELFEQGFSTKGDNRGLGLSTLKELTDSNENVLLDTVIENGYFVQKVEINNKES